MSVCLGGGDLLTRGVLISGRSCFKTLVVKCRKRKMSFVWKHRIFQQKRKLHGGEVKGHYFGNRVDGTDFPADECPYACMC